MSQSGVRSLSVSARWSERFGTSQGESGWKWDNNGIGMGGKDAGMIEIYF